MKSQLIAFRASLIQYGHEKCPVLKSWLEAFIELNVLITAGRPGRKVIFIDELPWMDTPKSGMLTGLEYFWNAVVSARQEKDIFLVVCGSASSWIVKNLLKNTEGLYGRLTDRIQLKPFSLSECEEYASRLGLGFTRQEVADAYMIFGGVPYYWSLMNPRLSLAQNVDELVFAADGKLRDEYRYLYASIFKNAEMHVKVVEALAEKKCGMSREEIIQATGLKNGGNFKILLEELEQCDFIRSYVPFGRKNRGTIYQLIDNFTLFYRTFLAHAARENKGAWLAALDTPKVQIWHGLAFERLCLQHVEQIKRALGVSGIRVGVYSWRGAHAQIDLLLDRADRTVDVCEIKGSYGEYELDKEEYDKLQRRKLEFVETTGTRNRCRLVLITFGGLKKNMYWGAIQSHVSLDDLFTEI